MIEPDSEMPSSDDEQFLDALDGSKHVDELSDAKNPRVVNREFDDDEEVPEGPKEEAPRERIDEAEEELRRRREAEERLTDEELQKRRAEAKTMKEKANQLYLNNDHDEAISIYTEASEICPLRFNEDRAIIFSNRAAANLKKVRFIHVFIHPLVLFIIKE